MNFSSEVLIAAAATNCSAETASCAEERQEQKVNHVLNLFLPPITVLSPELEVYQPSFFLYPVHISLRKWYIFPRI
jgi:hypothetical protein